ncbi:MAG: hypothetical protein IT260_06775 [Saprospiraceae bacterium]|nr:hypothetical protein [Saprospiraceae bacterium]
MIQDLPSKKCSDCGFEKSIIDFYKSKTHSNGVMPYCKNCFNIRCTRRWVQRKIKAIHYKGSQCDRCQLNLNNTHYSVFEFHHLNPKIKEFNWTKLRMTSWEKITQELDKCILLCANCHRIIHAEIP